MLKPDRAAGSRMHVLDWLDGGTFVSSINEMLRPTGLFVPQSGKCMPRGWDSPDEARLGKQCGLLIDDSLNTTLLDWWLVKIKGANVPNWDVACEALYDGNRPALVLAEAKAYEREFTGGAGGNAAQNDENRKRIKEAIEEAKEGLSRHTQHPQQVKISSDEWYQFSNRVAFAWKLASLGVPTALIYIGFLRDQGISDDCFQDHDHWCTTVQENTNHIFPSILWERRLEINGTPLWFLLRSLPSARQSHFATSHVRTAPHLLTGRDLIVALSLYLRLRKAENDLADYWRKRFKLLSAKLGLPSDWHENPRTPRMIAALSEDIRTDGFFSRFLEYAPLPGESIIMDHHIPLIKAAETDLRERLLDFAETLLFEFWPEVRGIAVKEDDLVVAGLPPERPDPTDYL